MFFLIQVTYVLTAKKICSSLGVADRHWYYCYACGNRDPSPTDHILFGYFF